MLSPELRECVEYVENELAARARERERSGASFVTNTDMGEPPPPIGRPVLNFSGSSSADDFALVANGAEFDPRLEEVVEITTLGRGAPPPIGRPVVDFKPAPATNARHEELRAAAQVALEKKHGKSVSIEAVYDDSFVLKTPSGKLWRQNYKVVANGAGFDGDPVEVRRRGAYVNPNAALVANVPPRFSGKAPPPIGRPKLEFTGPGGEFPSHKTTPSGKGRQVYNAEPVAGGSPPPIGVPKLDFSPSSFNREKD